MTKRTRQQYSPRFKAEVAISAVRGETTLEELAEKYGVHRNQIQQWRNILVDRAERVFERSSKQSMESDYEKIRELHAKIGELMMERDCLFKVLDGRVKPRDRRT